MQRLVFICPDVPGGVRSYISNLSTFLGQKDIPHTVILYSQGDSIRAVATLENQPQFQRISFSRYGTARSAYQQLTALIRKDDILLCNDSFELEAINYFQLPNKTIYILHGDLHHYANILQGNNTMIDGVLCVSNGLRQKYELLYPAIQFEVGYPLISNFDGTIRSSAERVLSGVFIGRFEYLKGADIFNEVARYCIENNIPITWKVFTPTQGMEKELAAELPASAELILDISNGELLKQLELTDILVFPSRSEGFGIAVLEAMKRGVVPIARNLPIGIPDMIRHGETGLLADEAAEIVPLIRRLADDRTFLLGLKTRARQFSVDFFDFQLLGERFLNNIAALTKRTGGGDKKFAVPKIRRVERLLPELVYRTLKYFHNLIKHSSQIS